MATQEDYERIVSLPKHYNDFRITKRDLPTTEGRFEHYLSERNIPTKNIRIFLVLFLLLITFSTIGIFFLSHPAFAQINNLTANTYSSSNTP